ncbi:energy transducer TonB [Sphingobium sp. SCG-1]|uniref:M56 family metallopeptidase n=1 Tax=Sphingobium sp. SCG-1 TaxID=2072936 RepID=UPI000CD6BCCA|nr:M56 family metallopeptidase [Sphingobium sp. SCG-1]AUW59485.1 energy transducer TonB [Sphingobium sp. SCG-1]
MSGPDFTRWLVEALLASALLIALVMLLRRPVAQYLGARAAYALWALPVLRLLLPPLPSAASPVAMLPLDSHLVSISHVREAVQVPAAQFPWVEAGLVIWMSGAVLFLLVQAIAYARFRRLILSDGAEIGRDGNVAVLESVHVTGPLAFGILHRRVVVPIDFADRYSREEQALALAHELTHHRRGDLIANLAALMLLTLHWCNPIAWIAYRAFRADQELACDAQVLARHGADQAQTYGRAILKAATATPLSAGNRFNICHLNSVDTLKGRLKMLSNHTASLHHISWSMAAIAVVTVAGLALTASGSGAAREMASVSSRLSEAKLTKLAAFMPEEVRDVAAPVTPETPETPTTPTTPVVAVTPTAPTAPSAPFEPAAPLPPPAPAAPRAPVVNDHYHAVPSRAEIARMVPDIRVDTNCAGQPGSSHEYVDASGKRHVRIAVCTAAIRRQAMADARAGMAEAQLAAAEARREAAQDRAQAQAEARAEMAEARAELVRARAEMRREMARAQAEVD